MDYIITLNITVECHWYFGKHSMLCMKFHCLLNDAVDFDSVVCAACSAFQNVDTKIEYSSQTIVMIMNIFSSLMKNAIIGNSVNYIPNAILLIFQRFGEYSVMMFCALQMYIQFVLVIFIFNITCHIYLNIVRQNVHCALQHHPQTANISHNIIYIEIEQKSSANGSKLSLICVPYINLSGMEMKSR